MHIMSRKKTLLHWYYHIHYNRSEITLQELSNPHVSKLGLLL